MKKRLFFACLLALASSPALAQVPVATPSPDPHYYADPGMTFTAPAGSLLVNRITVTPDQLSSDLQPVAAWVINPGKEDQGIIQIAMESYQGAPDQWEGQFESQTHGAQDGTLIRNKTSMSLQNGMPAYFVEVAYGSGFDSRKEYAIVWADGLRGVVLSVTTRLGDIGSDQAKTMLSQATAVRYPVDQP